jgi:hypothetical protein
MPVKGKILTNLYLGKHVILQKILNEIGYELYQRAVGEKDSIPLTYEEIKKYDALLLREDNYSFSLKHAEVYDIKRYVTNDNGGLLLIYEPTIAGIKKKENPYNLDLMNIGNVFGIQDLTTDSKYWEYISSLDLYIDLSKNEKNKFSIENHSITNGIKELSRVVFCPLKINKEIATSIININATLEYGVPWRKHSKLDEIIPPPPFQFEKRKENYSIFAINNEHRVVATSMVFDIFEDENINYGDNKQLALNLFSWLCENHIKNRVPKVQKRLPFVYYP